MIFLPILVYYHISARKSTKKNVNVQLSCDFFCIFIDFLYLCGQNRGKL